MDSHNFRNVTMENCGNMIQSSSSSRLRLHGNPSRIIQIIVLGPFSLRRTIKFYIPNPMQSPMVCDHPAPSLNILNIYSSLGRRNSPDLLTHMCHNPDISTPVSTAVQDTLPTEFTTSMSSPSDLSLQMNAQCLLSPSQAFGTIVPSYFSGDHIYHHLKYLERLLDRSLATAAVIPFSGNTLADILTPRAQDTLYALLALNMLVTSSKPRVRDIPAHSALSDFDIGNDQCPFHHSLPPPPNSGPDVVPSTACRINISISMDYNLNVLFAVVGISFLAFFIINLSGLSSCGKNVGGLS